MNVSKMVLVPEQHGGNESIDQPKRIDRNPEKIQRLLKIVLKIAMNNAYDEDFKIKDSEGKPISDSDITTLLNNAISPQKILVGESDFVRVLYESGVDPNWIVNENLRSKLLNYRPSNKPHPKPEININKRKIEDTEDTSRKKTTPWETPLPDSDDDEL